MRKDYSILEFQSAMIIKYLPTYLVRNKLNSMLFNRLENIKKCLGTYLIGNKIEFSASLVGVFNLVYHFEKPYVKLNVFFKVSKVDTCESYLYTAIYLSVLI